MLTESQVVFLPSGPVGVDLLLLAVVVVEEAELKVPAEDDLGAEVAGREPGRRVGLRQQRVALLLRHDQSVRSS